MPETDFAVNKYNLTSAQGNFSASAVINIKSMKKNFLLFAFVFFGFFLFVSSTYAQKTVEPQIQRDPVLEADSKHNLDVSWQYFKLKKAYKAVKLRLDETVAANPNFSKMDEVLYLLGMSNYYLSEGKGKQTIVAKTDDEKATYDPANLRSEADSQLSELVEKYPNSKYKDDAEKTLKLIKAKK